MLNCVGPCQGPSITSGCPAELETQCGSQPSKWENKSEEGTEVRLRERREGRERGEGRSEKLNNSKRQMGKKEEA